MKLYTRCKECGEFINYNARVEDRFQLAKKKGEKIKLACEACNASKKYHVNELTAEVRNSLSLIAMLVFVFGTVSLFIIVFYFIERLANIYAISSLIGIVSIPFLIYQSINHSEEERVRYFNSKTYG